MINCFECGNPHTEREGCPAWPEDAEWIPPMGINAMTSPALDGRLR